MKMTNPQTTDSQSTETAAVPANDTPVTGSAQASPNTDVAGTAATSKASHPPVGTDGPTPPRLKRGRTQKRRDANAKSAGAKNEANKAQPLPAADASVTPPNELLGSHSSSASDEDTAGIPPSSKNGTSSSIEATSETSNDHPSKSKTTQAGSSAAPATASKTRKAKRRSKSATRLEPDLGQTTCADSAEKSEQAGLQKKLNDYEAIIRSSAASIFEAGNAVTRVRDEQLYRTAGYRTIEEYGLKRLLYGRSQLYRLIDAARIAALLAGIEGVPQPTMEAQTRPLCGLNDDPAKQVWIMAVEASGGKQPTGRLVAEIAAQFKPPKKPRKPKLPPEVRAVLERVSTEFLGTRLALKQGFDIGRILPGVDTAIKEIRTLLMNDNGATDTESSDGPATE